MTVDAEVKMFRDLAKRSDLGVEKATTAGDKVKSDWEDRSRRKYNVIILIRPLTVKEGQILD